VGLHKYQHRTTIYRHLRTLLDAGILKRKEFKGKGMGIEIEINPELLIADKYIDKDTLAELSELRKNNPTLESEKILNYALSFKRFPKGYVALCCIKDIDTYTNINMSAEKRIVLKKEFLQKKENEKIAPENDWLKKAQVLATLDRTKKEFPSGGEKFPLSDKHQNELDYYATYAWAFARKVLYGDKYFSYQQCELTKKYIREYFEAIREKDFSAFIEPLLMQWKERVLLARRYADKSPERFIPVPWKYFDRHFPYGFAGTKGWYDKMQAQRKKNRYHYQNLREFCRLYKNYLKTPDLFYYKQAERILSKDPFLLTLFYQCVLSKDQFNAAHMQAYYQKGGIELQI
jgi:hypothetical protein